MYIRDPGKTRVTEENKMNQGKIVLKKVGLITTYSCTCGAGACEADEGSIICYEEFGGCGAMLIRGEE